MMVSKVTRILKSEMPRIYRFNNLINVLRIEDKHHTHVLPNNGRRPVLGLHVLQRNEYCCLVMFLFCKNKASLVGVLELLLRAIQQAEEENKCRH